MFKKGKAPWNKGISMPTSMRIKMNGNTNGKGNKGHKHSEESKIKISLAKKGIPTGIGRKHSSETLKKMSEAKLGRKHSLEHRENNRKGQYRRHLKNNPDYIPDSWLDLRKKRIKMTGGFHSSNEWETLKAQYNWTCPCCHKGEPKIKLTKDHIVPISKGGSDNIENIQPLCHSCNCKKHTRTIKY